MLSGSYQRRPLSGGRSCFPSPAPVELFSKATDLHDQGKNTFPSYLILSYQLVGGQLFFQLLRLFFDGAQVVLHRLPRMHPSVKAVVQPSPKPARETEISNTASLLLPLMMLVMVYNREHRHGNSSNSIFALLVITYLKQWGAVDGQSGPWVWLCPGR